MTHTTETPHQADGSPDPVAPYEPPPTPHPPGTAPAGAGTLRRLGIVGLMLGMFLAMLDSLIIATALPTIIGDLGGFDQLSWAITAYLLATAVSTPIWGKLGDLFGRKPMFMSSIVIFLAGSTLSGLAQDMGQLIGFRALQGLGGGGLMVGALAIIFELVPPREGGRIQALIAGMMPLAFGGGPLIGGLLTDHLSWRWVFYVNVPLGTIALVATAVAIHTHTPRVKARIDVVGALLLSVGLVSLTLLTSWAGTRYAWRSTPIIGLAALAVATLVAFGYVEGRVAEPILPRRLFRDRNVGLALVLSFLTGAAMFTATNFLPQYTQNARGVSSTRGGLLLLPLMLAMVAMMFVGGAVVARTGRYRIFPLLGGVFITAGMLVLLVVDADTNTLLGALLAVLVGIGVGALMQNTVVITMNSVEPRDIGTASGVTTLARIIGGSLGVALLGAVYTSRLRDSLVGRLGAGEGGRLASGNARMTPGMLRTLPPPVRDAFADAVSDGLHGVLIGGVVIGLLACLIAPLIRAVPLRTGRPGGAGADA